MQIRNLKYYQKPLKYKNKSCYCRQNHWHASIKEAHYCDQLELLVKAGEILSYMPQRSYDLKVNGQKICKHIPDFTIETKTGWQVHEVKSPITMTAVWSIKRKLFEALYPEMEYIVII